MRFFRQDYWMDWHALLQDLPDPDQGVEPESPGRLFNAEHQEAHVQDRPTQKL